MLSVAIYARVSTDEQAEHGYSLPGQIEQCQARARAMEADEITVYSDPAESSMTLDRPGLTAMRVAIAEQRHNCIIVWDQDRLSRDAIGSLVLRDEILSAGCQLIFLQGGATTTNPDDLLLYGIKALMAQSERIKIRARTMMGRRRKAEMGIMPVKFRLYGYSHNTKTKQITIVPEQAEWVRKMFEWCANEQVSSWIIAKRLAVANAPSPTGRGWYKQTVHRILKNEAYTGRAYANKFEAQKKRRAPRNHEEWIPVAIPAIVSTELWEKAQATLNQNREATQHLNTHEALLRGLLKCGHCGKGMRTFISPGTRHIPRYYCNPTTRFRPDTDNKAAIAAKQCPGSSVRMAVIDPVVLDWATKFLEDPERVLTYSKQEVAETAALEEEVKLLEGALAQCQETRQGILGFYSSRLISKQEADQQLNRVRKDERVFERRLKEARAMLSAAPVSAEVELQIESIRSRLKNAMSIAEQGDVLRDFIDYIEVWANPDFSLPPALKIHLRIGQLVTAAMAGTRAQSGL